MCGDGRILRSSQFSISLKRAAAKSDFLRNLQNQRDVKLVQCGLPGEKSMTCTACESDVPEESLKILRPILGSKDHIDWHAKWHKLRLGAESVNEELYSKLQQADLAPVAMTRDQFFKIYGVGGTLAGENFFFMHRLMIKMVQFELAMNGKSCIAPWFQLPDTINDKLFPVPHNSSSDEQV